MHFVIFIDDLFRKVWVYFMRHKSEAFAKFKLWKAKVENWTRKKVKCLKTDNDIEYTNDKFGDFYEQHGIKRHFIVCKTPQQNGVVKRMNGSIAETT
jgi:transposase InsO family protein